MPDFTFERAHGGLVAGVDEAGRGPLAGPVVAAALIFLVPPQQDITKLIDDSKALSETKRNQAFARLTTDPNIAFAVAAASVGEIFTLNILHASMLAMQRAVARLPKTPDLALIDGNRAPKLTCPTQCIIGGDAKSSSIAAASIIAKVIRDRAMLRLALRYPVYAWEKNAGYPTLFHREAITEHGPTRHHRMGFGPLKAMSTTES